MDNTVGRTPEKANKFARRAVALCYYSQNGVSIGYCAQIAGMTEEDFIEYLGDNNISIFHFDDKEEFLEELAARVYSCLRRAKSMGDSSPAKQEYRYKNLILCPDSRRVTVKGQELTLTPHEYEILLLLVQSPEKVYSRETMYEKVWNGGYYGEDNTVNVHVSNLRKKIAAADAEEEYIRTVWGIGFKMA